MKKFYTLALAAGLAMSAFAQQMPEAGKYYYLVNGIDKTYSQTEQRPNSCFGVRTQTQGDYFGVQNYTAGNEHELWQFVASPENPALYAMVNKAGEYVPEIGIIFNQNGAVYQDTRFEVKTITNGVIPAEAYGFTVNAAGTISDSDIASYDTSIHGMKAGDTYITIKPQRFDNNGTIQDNTEYYLNAAGNGRQFVINLWTLEDAPKNSEFWILVPENTTVEPEPVPALGTENANYVHLVNGFQGTYANNEQRPNACFGVKTDGDTKYYGMTPFVADDAHQQWAFIPGTENPALYAMVNKAGEYVPSLGTIMTDYSGDVFQDTRFAVMSASGVELPADAYAFTVNEVGAITEAQLANYDSSIHGMKVGDKYITIKPQQYRASKNNPTDPEYVFNNDAENAPVDPAVTSTKNPPYYLNASGNGRSFYIHLWFLETNYAAPNTSQYWIVIPDPNSVVAPAVPEVNTSITQVNNIVTFPKDGSVDVTITAEADAKVAYAFVEAAENALPEFSTLDSNVATLRIDKAGILQYYAVRGDLQSKTASLTFKVDTANGITEIENAQSATDNIYDLSGRRVANPQKGIFIINGKKAIVK